MPPVNYSLYKQVVPQGGIAEAIPQDPSIAGRAQAHEYALFNQLGPEAYQYLQEQRQAAIPWTQTAKDVASNAVNTFKNASAYEMAKGAVMGAYDAATLPGDVVTGKQILFNPDGTPNEDAIARSLNFAGMVTLGPSAIPREGFELRSGLSLPQKPPHPKNHPESVRQAEIKDGWYLKSEEALQLTGRDVHQ